MRGRKGGREGGRERGETGETGEREIELEIEQE